MRLAPPQRSASRGQPRLRRPCRNGFVRTCPIATSPQRSLPRTVAPRPHLPDGDAAGRCASCPRTHVHGGRLGGSSANDAIPAVPAPVRPAHRSGVLLHPAGLWMPAATAPSAPPSCSSCSRRLATPSREPTHAAHVGWRAVPLAAGAALGESGTLGGGQRSSLSHAHARLAGTPAVGACTVQSELGIPNVLFPSGSFAGPQGPRLLRCSWVGARSPSCAHAVSSHRSKCPLGLPDPAPPPCRYEKLVSVMEEYDVDQSGAPASPPIVQPRDAGICFCAALGVVQHARAACSTRAGQLAAS